MQTSLRRLLLFVAVASLVAVVPPPPAHADTDACTGIYDMTLSNGLGFPVLTSNTATFYMTMSLGSCATKAGIAFSGVITGGCWFASGSGATSNNHEFSFEWYGTAITFSGELTGQIHLNEAGVFAACQNGTGSRFGWHGAVAKAH